MVLREKRGLLRREAHGPIGRERPSAQRGPWSLGRGESPSARRGPWSLGKGETVAQRGPWSLGRETPLCVHASLCMYPVYRQRYASLCMYPGTMLGRGLPAMLGRCTMLGREPPCHAWRRGPCWEESLPAMVGGGEGGIPCMVPGWVGGTTAFCTPLIGRNPWVGALLALPGVRSVSLPMVSVQESSAL